MSDQGAGARPEDDRVLSIIRDELAPYGEVATVEVPHTLLRTGTNAVHDCSAPRRRSGRDGSRVCR